MGQRMLASFSLFCFFEYIEKPRHSRKCADADAGNGLVHVKLNAHGWQDGEPWQRGWEYFDSAWGFVLDAMKQYLESR